LTALAQHCSYDGKIALKFLELILIRLASCGLQSCKNRPAPFPDRMSYKATKPGLDLFYILACFNCIVAYQGPFLCIVNFRWYVFCLLVVLVKLSLLDKDWLERPLWGSLTVARGSSP